MEQPQKLAKPGQRLSNSNTGTQQNEARASGVLSKLSDAMGNLSKSLSAGVRRRCVLSVNSVLLCTSCTSFYVWLICISVALGFCWSKGSSSGVLSKLSDAMGNLSKSLSAGVRHRCVSLVHRRVF